MRTNESEEMYLETILLLSNEMPFVRSIDIVAHLDYAKSSVSAAVNRLKGKGYIDIDRNGYIKLTQEGRIRAKNVYERHRVITSMLMEMGADKELAEENACRIEHVITEDMFHIIKAYLEDKH